MNAGLDWDRDGADWPHREASQFVEAGGLRWHVQRWPAPPHAVLEGLRQAQSERTKEALLSSVQPDPLTTARPEPVEGLRLALLLHGTGASTHSWRDLAPLLSQRFRVLAVDLPGHAFTGMPAAGTSAPQLSLPGMAQAVAQLLTALGEQPALIVGHSAGAAVAVRMALDGLASPQLIVGLNAALLPLRGLAGQVFSPVAKLMAGSAWVPKLFARHASDPSVARRLLESTGSQLDQRGLALYGRLVSNAGHAAGALAMMANWDLQTLADDLHRMHTPLALVVGMQDRTVRPSQADRVVGLLAAGHTTSITRLPGLGHLAHEEQPVEVAALIERLYGAQRLD